MPAVTFDGAVVERTNHRRYLGVHCDIMLTYRQHVETALKCKKGLSVLKAMAAKVIEQRHLFLLYQSVVLSVIDYGLGLNDVTDKSATAGQSAKRGNESHTGNHQGHTH